MFSSDRLIKTASCVDRNSELGTRNTEILLFIIFRIMKLRQPELGTRKFSISERASSDPDQPRARASSIRHQHHFRIISMRDGLRLIASKSSRCQQHAGMPASLQRRRHAGVLLAPGGRSSQYCNCMMVGCYVRLCSHGAMLMMPF
jgi:hypothetical protein